MFRNVTTKSKVSRFLNLKISLISRFPRIESANISRQIRLNSLFFKLLILEKVSGKRTIKRACRCGVSTAYNSVPFERIRTRNVEGASRKNGRASDRNSKPIYGAA